jgi:hypothetical protein
MEKSGSYKIQEFAPGLQGEPTGILYTLPG